MVTFLFNLLKATRPRQWIKNSALLGGLLFSGQLSSAEPIFTALYHLVIFCATSSATYLLNDVFDIERDKLHPFKSKRPIASGKIPSWFAVGLAFVIIMVILPLAYNLSPAFFLAVILYLLLQLLYSAYLKSVILLDVMTIAAGFVLRVYAGIWAIDAHLNVWFLLTVISFSLFLAIGKRRSELTLMQSQASKTRETLLHYPENLLDILTAMFANATWLAYAFFTFLQPPIYARPRLIGLFSELNLPFTQAKYLMATIPIVIYAVMRYLYIIYEKKEGESPERVLLTDRPLLFTVILYSLVTIAIIYFLGS